MAPLKKLCFALLLVHFLLASSSSSSLSPSFTPIDNYLINCGSIHNVTLHNRLFLADTHSSRLTDPTNASSALYRTARLFSAASSYTFQIRTTGYHFLRMHFHPFKALNFDLHSANFSVYVNGNLTFSSTNSTSVVVVVVKEFILFLTPVEIGQKNIILDVRFVPASKLDFAYVNAIEVFSAPDDLILENGAKSVGPVGVDDYIGLSSRILETLHRVNVGGSTLTPFNDTLWRTWVNDEDFLVLPSAAKLVATTHIPNYQSGGASREVAPDHVYMTAQEMNRDNLTDARFNISWEFPVGSSGGQEHLVRLHFCDIVSASLNQLYFNVYINEYLGYKDLDLSALTSHMLASPYYLDFVTESDDKGALRISVGPSDLSSTLTVNAILNGVEVMKLINPVSLPPKTDRKDVWILLGSVLGGFGALTVVLVLVMGLKCLKRKQKPRRTESIGWTNMRDYGGSTHKSIKSILASPGPDGYIAVKIPFVDIQTATNNFHTELIVGSGGFGTVFKGVLGDNTKVAVKRGVQGSRQGRPEFQSEIAILSKIRHRHLVSLIGYCEEQSEMILVYEYMENGPLKKHLYGADCGHLSWKQRLEICIGAARGLHYLHTGSAQGIIHRDVKSTNILLDGNYVAKVGDFGLSRSGPCVDETHVSTIVKGSFGYLDPEYFRRQQLTDKSDVYSFGVLLLEVVCARPAVDPLLAREQVNLAEWAMLWLKKDLLEQIIDPRLVGQIKPISLKKFGETAEKCLADYGVDRPTMGDVLWNLECALQLQEAETRNQQEHETSIPGSGSEAPPAIDEVHENEENGSLEISTTKVFSQLMNNNGR